MGSRGAGETREQKELSNRGSKGPGEIGAREQERQNRGTEEQVKQGK
jgi:hypothetical protein